MLRCQFVRNQGLKFGRLKTALGYKEKSFLKFRPLITLPLSNSREYPEASSQME
jgi:hypothetical protein